MEHLNEGMKGFDGVVYTELSTQEYRHNSF